MRLINWKLPRSAQQGYYGETDGELAMLAAPWKRKLFFGHRVNWKTDPARSPGDRSGDCLPDDALFASGKVYFPETRLRLSQRIGRLNCGLSFSEYGRTETESISTLYVNAALSDVYRAAEPELARDGLIAVQIHGEADGGRIQRHPDPGATVTTIPRTGVMLDEPEHD